MTTQTAATAPTSLTSQIETITQDFAPTIGRVLLSSVFLMSGISKISAYEATAGYMSAMGVPGGLLPLVIAFETAAALALILGWRARMAAFLLAGFSLLTALIFHFDFADQIQTIMFLKNVSIAGGLFMLVGFGPGRFALNR